MIWHSNVSEWDINMISSNKYWIQGIGLHFFEHEDIKWKEWHDYCVSEFAKLELTPHRGGVSGKDYGYSTWSMTYEGTKKKLERFNWGRGEISNIYFMSLLPDAIITKDVGRYLSDCCLYSGFDPGYNKKKPDNPDDPFKAWMSFLIEESTKPFDIEYFNNVALKLHQFTRAKYGYFFRYPLNCSPSSYIRYDDKASKDPKASNRWYKALKWHWISKGEPPKQFPSKILGYLRDIFRINFLSHSHLNRKVGDITLEQWILQNTRERGILKELSDGFYSWSIEDESLIPKIRQELSPHDIIIATIETV